MRGFIEVNQPDDRGNPVKCLIGIDHITSVVAYSDRVLCRSTITILGIRGELACIEKYNDILVLIDYATK